MAATASRKKESKRPADTPAESPDGKKRKLISKTSGSKKPFKRSKPAGKPLDRKARKARAEEIKKKKKPNYNLQKDSVLAWEKMRQRNLSDEERKSIVSETLKNMKGKYLEMARSPTTSRVLQSCVKHCQEAEREEVFRELKPHFFTLAEDSYGCHLALRMLDHAKRDQLGELVAALRGNVVQLARHPTGCTVLERAYALAAGTQKHEMVSEFFSPEFRLFRNISSGKGRISDVLRAEPAKRKIIFEHMTLALQPILEKGIVDHSIIHRALVEYLTISSQKTIQGVVEQLAPWLVRMIHTADGARLGVLCLRSGTAKERKKIIKGMKGHVLKVAQDDHGYAVLMSAFDVVDDTDLVNKVIMSAMAKGMKDICLNKYAHRLILHLLAPKVSRYFPFDILKILDRPLEPYSGVKSTENKDEPNVESREAEKEGDVNVQNAVISKKDPSVRRTELLSKGDFAQKLTEACAAHADELLRSPFAKDVIFEVAAGGADGILFKLVPKGVTSVHQAIADLVASPKQDQSAGAHEHVLEHYHASRTIRRLLLDTRCHSKDGSLDSFSGILWSTALKGRLETWARGHSAKVVAALRDSQDPGVKQAAKRELQSLIACGLLDPSGQAKPGSFRV